MVTRNNPREPYLSECHLWLILIVSRWWTLIQTNFEDRRIARKSEESEGWTGWLINEGVRLSIGHGESNARIAADHNWYKQRISSLAQNMSDFFSLESDIGSEWKSFAWPALVFSRLSSVKGHLKSSPSYPLDDSFASFFHAHSLMSAFASHPILYVCSLCHSTCFRISA